MADSYIRLPDSGLSLGCTHIIGLGRAAWGFDKLGAQKLPSPVKQFVTLCSFGCSCQGAVETRRKRSGRPLIADLHEIRCDHTTLERRDPIGPTVASTKGAHPASFREGRENAMCRATTTYCCICGCPFSSLDVDPDVRGSPYSYDSSVLASEDTDVRRSIALMLIHTDVYSGCANAMPSTRALFSSKTMKVREE